jgi:hypothetical protein
MEIVTLAHVTLYRPGSASGYGFAPCRQVHKVAEVRDERPETLRGLVETLAVAEGENAASLGAMQQAFAPHFTSQPGVLVFNVQGPSTQYGTPYATVLAHPALKVGDRYFKLEEVKVG